MTQRVRVFEFSGSGSKRLMPEHFEYLECFVSVR